MNRMVHRLLGRRTVARGCWTIASLGTSLLPSRTTVGRIDKARHPRAEKLRSAVDQETALARESTTTPSIRPTVAPQRRETCFACVAGACYLLLYA